MTPKNRDSSRYENEIVFARPPRDTSNDHWEAQYTQTRPEVSAWRRVAGSSFR